MPVFNEPEHPSSLAQARADVVEGYVWEEEPPKGPREFLRSILAERGWYRSESHFNQLWMVISPYLDLLGLAEGDPLRVWTSEGVYNNDDLIRRRNRGSTRTGSRSASLFRGEGSLV